MKNAIVQALSQLQRGSTLRRRSGARCVGRFGPEDGTRRSALAL